MAAMIECERMEELLAVASLGALPPEEGVELTEHLARCASCRDTARDYAALVDLLPSTLTPAAPPARLRRSLLSQVYAGAAPARVQRPPVWRRVWESLPRSRGLTLGLAAAAATATGAAAVALALALGGGGRGTAPATPPVESFRVTGTTAEPAAGGTVAYDPAAHRAVLTVRGLPAPIDPAGGPPPVYEVWLIPAHGPPVPSGFLTLQPDGRTWVSVVGGDLRGYSTLAATAEPAGGTRAPTGSEVISAALQ